MPEQDTSTSAGGTFPIVGIGASAGGLEAITELLRALPPETGLSFVVVQHLSPNHVSMLADILARSSRMPVTDISDEMLVEPNHIYVMPAGSGVILSRRVFRLTAREADAGLHLPIDAFFRSLAEQRKNGAIAVILSGTASDGSLGLEAIKAEGGITFAQDEQSAKFPDMPRNAVATGCVDYVLTPAEIASELVRIGHHPYIIREDTAMARADAPGEAIEDFSELFKLLRETTGVDFSEYRATTIQRRIQRRQALHSTETLQEYLKYLRENPAEIQALYQDLLIKVTQFFRDPKTFDALKLLVFPRLLQNRSPKEAIRFWVSGCSTGEEAYSLAICLLESQEPNKCNIPVQIFASDINPAAIERARSGFYLENVAADITPERLERFFTRTDNGYRINKEIRELCIFAPQDLIKDPPYSKLDLITCRNVLIYMGAVQKRIIPLFHYALKPSGFLMLGTSESANSFSDLFATVDEKSKIYSKKEGAHRPFLYHTLPAREEAADKGGRQAQGVIGGLPDFQKLADRVVLDKYGPARVLVDDNLDVIEIGGDVKAYLEIPSGRASLNLLKMSPGVRLPIELHAAFEKAKKDGAAVRKERIKLEQAGESRDVNIEVIPLASKHGRTFLVLFDELPPRAAEPEPPHADNETLSPEQRVARERIRSLEQDLAQTRQHLLSVIEEHTVSGADAQSVQEESQSNIEELQSVNEELETAKEEMQSGNEELQTINEELQTRTVELGHSRDFAQSIVETIRHPLLVLDTELRVRTANQAFYQFFQAAPANTEGQLVYQVEGGMWNTPDFRTMLREVLPSNRFFNDFELDREFPKVGRKVLLLSARQLDHVQMILLSINDITERKNAERTLRKTEEHLRHAQKMEAVGRLAGGVAHDFNNLLTGILGCSELLLDRITPDDPDRKEIEEIKKAGERAAALTQQLLAFSRRQLLQPKVLQLGTLVADMERMLRRLIGEHIELVITSDKALGPIRADAGQIGQIIMNLALNSRDAMFHGGKLTIETRNVDLNETTAAAEQNLEPGRYVVLAVKDTGVGMDPETQAHLFEPFFTTKGKGLGTGLGLATVYGIVEQSGAKLQFSTGLGRGTTFKIFFPQVAEPVEKPGRPSGAPTPVARGSEVILLVEDDDTVRRLARTFLENMGYEVLEAGHGGEGLALCKEHRDPIHLLLTDIVMPEMGGRELSEQAAPLHPEMKVLFMSGYTDDTLVREGIKVQGVPFLQKPFTLHNLAHRVREVLDDGRTEA